jgi:membrane protein YqaA with SNARE-associated domain
MTRRLAADPADLLAAFFGLCLGFGLVCFVAAYILAANAEAMGVAVSLLAGAAR